MAEVVHSGGLNLGDSGRFTVLLEAENGKSYPGYVEYHITDRGMDLVHTVVAPELRGKGVAAIVVSAAFNCASKNNLKVIPTCSYIPVFLKKNPEFQPMANI